MAILLGPERRCQFCGEWCGVNRRKWCVDCERKANLAVEAKCTFPGCDHTYKKSGQARYCAVHKGMVLRQREKLARELGYERLSDRVPTRAHLEDAFEELDGSPLLDLAVLIVNWANYQLLSEDDPELAEYILTLEWSDWWKNR